MKGLRTTGLWIFLVSALAAPALAQRSSGASRTIPSSGPPYPGMGGPPTMGPMSAGGGDPMSPADVVSGRLAVQQARTRNNERQKRLETDTDKLVDMVNSFKEQVKGELSPADVSKRAEEIEKLARSVKDRMKG